MNNLKVKETLPIQKSFALTEGVYTLGSSLESSIKFHKDVFQSEDVLSITITNENEVFIGCLSHSFKLLLKNNVVIVNREVKEFLAGDTIAILGTRYSLHFSVEEIESGVHFVFSKGELNDIKKLSLVEDLGIEASVFEKEAELLGIEEAIVLKNEELSQLEKEVVIKSNNTFELESLISKASDEAEVIKLQLDESTELLKLREEEVNVALEEIESLKLEFSILEHDFREKEDERYRSSMSQQISLDHDTSLAKERLHKANESLFVVEVKRSEIMRELHELSLESTQLTLARNELITDIESKYQKVSELSDIIRNFVDESNDYNLLLEDKRNELRVLREEISRLSIENEITKEKNRLDFEMYFQDFENTKTQRSKMLELELENEVICHRQKIKDEEIEIRNKFQKLREENFEENKKNTQAATILSAELIEKAKKEATSIRERVESELKEKEAKAELLLSKREDDLKEIALKIEEKTLYLNTEIEAKRAESIAVLDKAHSVLEQKRNEASELIISTEDKCYEKIEKAKSDIAKMMKESRNEIDLIKKNNDEVKKKFDAEINIEKEKLRSYLSYRRDKNKSFITQLNEKHSDLLLQIREREASLLENEKRKVLKRMVNYKHNLEARFNNREKKQRQELRALKENELLDINTIRRELAHQVKELRSKKSSLMRDFENDQIQKFEKFKDSEMNKSDEARRAYESKLAIAVEGRILEIEDRNRKRVNLAAKGVYQLFLECFSDKIKLEELNKSTFEKDIVKCIDDVLNSNDIDADIEAGIRVSRDDIKGFEAHFKKHGLKAVSASLFAILIVGNLFDVRTKIVKSAQSVFQEHVDFTKKIQDKNLVDLSSEREFKPVMDLNFKDSYTDNVLYTKGFSEVYNNEAFQNEWVLGLYEYVVNELELPEEFAVNYVSSEGSLIRELHNIRDNIDNRFLDLSIKKMNALEEVFLNKTLEEVEGLENWNKILEFKKNFFLKNRNLK